MKISAALEPASQLAMACQIAFLPTLRAVLQNPLLLLRPREIGRIFFTHVWAQMGPGSDENTRDIKQGLITANASGVVVDIGAGFGHTALHLDRTKVTKYVALEPNERMHAEIRRLAASAGFAEEDGTLLILPYGAGDTALITSALGGERTAGTLVAVLSLCSVPEPERALAGLVRDVLRPGGTFVFYEHVLSPREDVGWWQKAWTPIWSAAFDGCCLDRPTHVWVAAMDTWAEASVWGKPDDPEENLWWHRIGRFVKKAD
ncbi:uncharacterized protein BXZ73DRAFT_88877 [Epithele typhae]|uniref:uncharacterized protein n=1 Tax=Epithele typhae TaxID=378194 RepID=UPI002008B8F5|nr:uncharacterized protein BXZ73DRAFT_88877 [Epithele typhae]KAH9939645.1 hypothetical protein BXZ73DRAFT_88877 [Epithele typhae]